MGLLQGRLGLLDALCFGWYGFSGDRVLCRERSILIQRRDFVQTFHEPSKEWAEVLSLASRLEAHLNERTVIARLNDANQPGQSSSKVQAVFLAEAKRLGFVDEAKGLFDSYESSALRPDYYRPLGNTGVIMEVERGKTTINNMDLLDFWKCHICEYADFLFLMVPSELRQNSG